MKRVLFAKYGYIVMSILFYVGGMAYIFLPELPMMPLCILGGLALLVYGAIRLVGYLSPDLYCLAFQYDMASAILLLILGVLVLACNVRLAGLYAAGIGVLILFDAVLTLQTAKDAAKFGMKSWVLLLIVSIIAAICGALIIIMTMLNSELAHHIVMGVALLAEGFMKHCLVLLTVQRQKGRETGEYGDRGPGRGPERPDRPERAGRPEKAKAVGTEYRGYGSGTARRTELENVQDGPRICR